MTRSLEVQMGEDLEPQDLAARQYMEHKGLGHLSPFDVEKLDDQPCWYYLYQLNDGTLELEVYWNGKEWETTVCTFNG